MMRSSNLTIRLSVLKNCLLRWKVSLISANQRVKLSCLVLLRTFTIECSLLRNYHWWRDSDSGLFGEQSVLIHFVRCISFLTPRLWPFELRQCFLYAPPDIFYIGTVKENFGGFMASHSHLDDVSAYTPLSRIFLYFHLVS